MKESVLNWLLSCDPWTEYRTRIDLLGESPDSEVVLSARARMVAHPLVASIVEELAGWPGTVLNSHKSAGQHYHKLSFLADLGLNQDDPGMNLIIEKIFKHTSEEGPFQLPTVIPVHFGGTGKEQYAWALCDAPVIVYSLAKMGLDRNEKVLKAKNYLAALGRENGYPCAASRELGRFRGPGRKEDPCPYATLVMLKLLSLYPEDRESDQANHAADILLTLWEKSRDLHPYIFYMGTDFRKIKAPFIWYDILHVADTLSNFPRARQHPALGQMISILLQKAGEQGLFTPESEWKAWKGWDFGQKKQPSAWLTFLAYRVLKRTG